ncbi:hypothetical protein ACFLZN_02375 [Nanoarchaeota archaeon]
MVEGSYVLTPAQAYQRMKFAAQALHGEKAQIQLGIPGVRDGGFTRNNLTLDGKITIGTGSDEYAEKKKILEILGIELPEKEIRNRKALQKKATALLEPYRRMQTECLKGEEKIKYRTADALEAIARKEISPVEGVEVKIIGMYTNLSIRNGPVDNDAIARLLVKGTKMKIEKREGYREHHGPQERDFPKVWYEGGKMHFHVPVQESKMREVETTLFALGVLKKEHYRETTPV